MARRLFGMTAAEAIEEGICISCNQIASEYIYSEAGQVEYNISGLCERCFDQLMKGGDR